MTKLGAGVNELEFNLLQGLPLGVGEKGLPEGEHPLLGSDAAALDHYKVLLHLTVVGEATHGVDGLVSKIVVGGSVVLDQLENKRKDMDYFSQTKYFEILKYFIRGRQPCIYFHDL